MRKMRVPLPVTRCTGWLALAKKIQAKHIADGPTSLLNRLDWPSINATIEKAQAMQQAAEAFRVQSEQRMTDRDAAMDEMRINIRSVRDLLTSVHIKNMKHLGDWGFDVIEAPATRKPAVVKADVSGAKPEAG